MVSSGGQGADSGNGPRFSLGIHFQSNLSPFSNIQTHFIFLPPHADENLDDTQNGESEDETGDYNKQILDGGDTSMRGASNLKSFYNDNDSQSDVNSQSQSYFSNNDSSLRHHPASQVTKQKKLKKLAILNGLRDMDKDIEESLSHKERSRGSTTDEKRDRSRKSKKLRLRYNQDKYKKQEEMVIEARKPKFGIFRKQNKNPGK